MVYAFLFILFIVVLALIRYSINKKTDVLSPKEKDDIIDEANEDTVSDDEIMDKLKNIK